MTLKHGAHPLILSSFGERLKALRGYASLSRADVEQQFGIPEVTLKSWEFNMQKDVSPKAVKRILEAFNSLGIPCTEEWLVFGVGASPFVPHIDDKTTPIKSSILEKVYFEEHNAGALTFEIQDSGLSPYFEVGDLVGGLPLAFEDLPKKRGAFCLFVTQKHERIVGRLANGSDKGFYSIVRDLSFKSSDALILDARFVKVYEIIWVRRPQG